MGERYPLLAIENARVVHFVFKDVAGDLDSFAFGPAENGITLILNGLVVVGAGEPIADGQILAIPFRLVFLLLFFLIVIIANSLRSLLQHIFDILKDDRLDRAVVDLTVLARALRCKIIYETAAKIVLHLNHFADHLASLAHKKFFRELSKFGTIGKSALVCGLEHLSGFLLRLLLTEGDGEDVVLHRLK